MLIVELQQSQTSLIVIPGFEKNQIEDNPISGYGEYSMLHQTHYE